VPTCSMIPVNTDFLSFSFPLVREFFYSSVQHFAAEAESTKLMCEIQFEGITMS
jgi:hypothetical protein